MYIYLKVNNVSSSNNYNLKCKKKNKYNPRTNSVSESPGRKKHLSWVTTPNKNPKVKKIALHLRIKTCFPCMHSLVNTEANVWENSRADLCFTCSRIFRNFDEVMIYYSNTCLFWLLHSKMMNLLSFERFECLCG